VDRLIWEFVIYNLICPALPVLFPWRVAATAAAVQVLPWWLVLIGANALGAIGMLPILFVFRHYGAQPWNDLSRRWPVVQACRRRFRRNMFGLQIALNATPLPDYVSCALAGSERYSVFRFWTAQFIGRTIHNLPLVIGGTILSHFPFFKVLRQMLGHPVVIGLAICAGLGWIAMRVCRYVGERLLTMMLCDEEN